MRDFGPVNSDIAGNLKRIYLIVYLREEVRVVFCLARACILGPERW